LQLFLGQYIAQQKVVTVTGLEITQYIIASAQSSRLKWSQLQQQKNVDRSHWQQTRKPHPFSAGAEALVNYIFRDEQEFSAPLFRSFLPLHTTTNI